MRSHMNKKGEGEKANQTVTKLPVRIKYWIYIIQLNICNYKTLFQ